MKIRIACPFCRKPLNVPKGTEGQRIQCPHCHQTSRVPGASNAIIEPSRPKPPLAPKPPSDPAMNPWAGITSMVMGILAVVFSCAWMCAIPFSILAIIFGLISLKHYKAGRGMGTAGFVLGICGFLLAVILIVAVIVQSSARDRERERERQRNRPVPNLPLPAEKPI